MATQELFVRTTKNAVPLAAALLLAAVATLQAENPANLRCEYLNNPAGIDVLKPRLSWQLTGNERGLKQVAYRVLVSASLANLARNQGEIWDSGKIASDQSIQVEYNGSPLNSGTRYFWKTIVWTNIGAVPLQSEPARWSMGFLHPQDWTGKWIGKSGGSTKDPNPPPAPMFRKTFLVRGSVSRATAYICGLGYHELSLNGSKVGDHVLDPPITNYDKRVIYVTHDVTSQLVPGKNVVGVVLGNSWYNTTTKDAWDFNHAPWRALPQLRFQMHIEYANGSTDDIVSDGSWKASTGPIVFDQTRVNEVYDARLEKPGWNSSSYDDAAWEAAVLREGPKGKLVAGNVEPIKVMATINPVSVHQPKPGIYVFDIGQNIAGWPRLHVRGQAGTQVTLRCGERVDKDGLIQGQNWNNIKQFVQSPDFQTDRYTLKGGGEETWEPKFTYHGFQYVQVEGLPTAATLKTLEGRVVYTSFGNAGSFECSNPLLNKIWRASVWSYKGNFVGFPTDCPSREKNGWTGDAQLAVQMGLEHFHAEAAYTRWMNDFDDAQRADGKLPSIVPTGGWGMSSYDGPAWESAYFLIPWEVYRQSGDKRLLENHYEGYKKWLNWYGKIAKNQVIEYGLGDWVPFKTKTPPAVTSTAYYYRDLLITAQVANWLGRDGESQAYRELAEKVRQAFNKTFFNPATGQYAGGTQTALSCALYLRLADPDQCQRVADNLARNVQDNRDHIDTGILGAKYILRALCDHGQADEAWKIASQKTCPGWGGWMEHGMTTLVEDWEEHASLNHIMFGDISSWFIEYLAGICPDDDAPGYKRIVIHPMLLGDLTSAKATRESPYGTIVSDWSRSGRQFNLKLVIPPNSTALVYLPTMDSSGVMEENKPALRSDGVKFLRVENKTAIFEVASGIYNFRTSVN